MDNLDEIARAQLAALLTNSSPGTPITAQQVAEAISQYVRDELAELEPPSEEVKQQGIPANEAHINESLEKGIELITELVDGNPHQRIKFNQDSIQKYFDGEDPWLPSPDRRELPSHNDFNIISAISGYPVITARLGLFLPPRELIKLYSISRDFHDAIDRHLFSSIVIWLRSKAPNAVTDFPFKLYGPSTTRDRAGRTFAYEMRDPIPDEDWVNTARIVPTLRWYHMVVDRERYTQQITAFLARSGHRLPPTMATTLKRMWLTMDVASNAGRVSFMKNRRFWTDVDLYNVGIFCIKLDMLFNDPIRGPSSDSMTKLMLGQRGLFPLWQLLYRKKFTTIPELVDLKVRYDYVLRPEHVHLAEAGMAAFTVPLYKVGRLHLEGWGLAGRHLYRPDELAMAESARRQLCLEDHLENMALWGLVDWHNGRLGIPSEEEMYLSDEDELLERVDTSVMFKMRHPKKQRWDTLTETEKEEIRIEERLEEVQAVKVARYIGYAKLDGTVEKYPEGQLPVLRKTNKENYDLHWEARRGWTSERLTKKEKKDALEKMSLYERQPTEEEQEALENELKDSLRRAGDMVSEDEKLRAQAGYNYDEDDLDFDHEGYAAQLDNGLVEYTELGQDPEAIVQGAMSEPYITQLMGTFQGLQPGEGHGQVVIHGGDLVVFDGEDEYADDEGEEDFEDDDEDVEMVDV